jgi:hypothetical protein
MSATVVGPSLLSGGQSAMGNPEIALLRGGLDADPRSNLERLLAT